MPMNSDTCASRLETLSQDRRFEPRRDDLATLATSIRAADGAWGAVDLPRAFPADSSIAPDIEDRTDHLLSLASLVAVFLPLAWTWWSFGTAVSTYRGTTGTGAPERANFFQQWATGFDGRLATAHRLGPMALISLGLIVLTVLVAVMHRHRSITAVRRQDLARAAAAAELASVLMHAQQICQDQRSGGTAAVDRSLRSVVGALKRVQSAATEAAGLFETNVVRLEKSLPAVDAALDHARTEITRVIEDSHTKSAELMVLATEPVASGASKIGHAAGRLETAVDELVAAVATTTALTTSVDDLGGTVGRLDQSVALNASAMQAQLSELTAARAAVVALVRELASKPAATQEVPSDGAMGEEAG